MRIWKNHPLLKLVNSYVVDSPQPSNLSYWWNFGSLLAFSLIIQIVTGVTLAMHYNTSYTEAFNSVEHIMRDVNNGWLIRYLHSNTASAFFFIVYLHIGRGLYYGSYKTPRTLVWTIGTIIFIIMIATAFLGYVLPYGQMSLWGATVITNLMSAIPWVGQDIVQFIWGGFSVNNATLNRFFALHFVLPFVLAALALMHLIVLHDRAGSGNPLGVSGNSDRLPFAPYYIFKDLITIFIFILVLSIFVFYMPNILGDSENYVMANPMQTPSAIVPEWYLLPFYAILRSIPNKLIGVIAMFSAILMLLIMPFSDLSISRGIQFNPLSKIFFFIFVGNFLALTQLGAKHVESPFIEFGQISTILYFVYFLIIIPSMNLFENSLTQIWLDWYNSKDIYKVNQEKEEEIEYIVPSYAVMQSFLPGHILYAGKNTNSQDNIDDENEKTENNSINKSQAETLDLSNKRKRDESESDNNEYQIEHPNKKSQIEKENEEENKEKKDNDKKDNNKKDNGKDDDNNDGNGGGNCNDNNDGKKSDDDDEWSTDEIEDDGLITDNDDDQEVDDYDEEKERVIKKWKDNNNNTSEQDLDTTQEYLPLQEESIDTTPGCYLPEHNINPLPECFSLSEYCINSIIEHILFYKYYINLILEYFSLCINDTLPFILCDAPRPWGIYFQDSGTPQMEGLVELHDNIMFYLVIILFGVGWLLMCVIDKFGDVGSGISYKFAGHGTTVEIIWTITPAIILILIAFPSFKLLYLMDEISDPAMVVLAEGHQWYWSYQYADFMNNDNEFIEFDSYLVPESDLEDGALRMLEVDNRVIIPELTHIRFVVGGGDVIHSFACPGLGLKCDAYPGRLNQSSLMINRPSTFYGQCSEICGILHSSMPIVVESVSVEKFVKWLVEQ